MNTFLFGCFGVLLAYMNGYPFTVLVLFFSFIIIQFIEFGLWKSIYAKNIQLNILFSIFACIVILSQPIASTFLLYPKSKKLMYILLGIYSVILITIIALSTNKSNPNFFISYAGQNGHLVWNWARKQNTNPLLLVTYMVFFLGPMLYTKNYFIFTASFVTLLFSLFFFYKYDTWQSMWCWTANICVFILVFKIIFIDTMCKTKTQEKHI